MVDGDQLAARAEEAALTDGDLRDVEDPGLVGVAVAVVVVDRAQIRGGETLASIRQTIASTVEQMPTQEEFLRDNGGAIDPAMQLTA